MHFERAFRRSDRDGFSASDRNARNPLAVTGRLRDDSLAAVHWIELIDEPEPVVAPDRVLYSTRPQKALGRDDFWYYLKGPDPAVVIAETLGYLLADRVGLPVPPFALCRHPGDGSLLFASRAVSGRSGIPVLADRGRLTNPEVIGECFAFDLWTANPDRNDGNFVAKAQPGGRAQLFAIDFESAKILRGVDRFTVAMMPARDFLPRGDAATHCLAGAFPAPMCSAIAAVTPGTMHSIMNDVGAAVGAAFSWQDAAADYLLRRAANVRTLVEEVWNA